MPRWGRRWCPSSLINTLGCSTTHASRSSVSQSVSQQSIPHSVNRSVVTQSVSSCSQSLTTTTTTTRTHGATPYVSSSPSVWLSQLSSCHGFEREDVYVTVTLSFSFFFSSVALPTSNQPTNQPTLPAAHPSSRPYPFFLQHPSNIYNDFGAAWCRLLELYILTIAGPGLLLSSSFVRVPHDTILGLPPDQVSTQSLGSVPRPMSCRAASSSTQTSLPFPPGMPLLHLKSPRDSFLGQGVALGVVVGDSSLVWAQEKERLRVACSSCTWLRRVLPRWT